VGNHHPDVATSLGNLAALYDNQGRYEAAEPLYIEALQLRKDLLGDRHPAVATSLNNLAELYYSQNRFAESEPLLLQALEIQQQVLGNVHPDTIVTQQILERLRASKHQAPNPTNVLLSDLANLSLPDISSFQLSNINNFQLSENILSRFFAPELVRRITQGQVSLDLSPKPRLITVLFSDMIGFTELSNASDSYQVSELLNEYLTEMTRVIFDNGGTIDKFMGDAVLAFFGTPEEITPHEQVQRAVNAARQMYHALEELNERWRIQSKTKVQFRCGIHQGSAVVGMFGNADRLDYSAIGSNVNVAARIQEAAEPNSILVSADVANYLDPEKDILHEFRTLQIKGNEKTVPTFLVHVNS
jgi:class 3 adenylate cyclase